MLWCNTASALRVVSGLLWEMNITGAIEKLTGAKSGHIEDSLVMRPFPRANPDESTRQRLWEEYRQELVSTAGICLVVFGNKKAGEQVITADGVLREFEIARRHHVTLCSTGRRYRIRGTRALEQSYGFFGRVFSGRQQRAEGKVYPFR